VTMQGRTGTDLGLRVLAKVDNLDASAIDAIEPYEGDEPYFPEYVDANFPRDFDVTDSIVAATTGYAIADDSGEVVARFEGERNGKTAYQRAQDAAAGATVTLAVDIQDDEDQPVPVANFDEAGVTSATAQEATE
jgi:hypothetical protein